MPSQWTHIAGLPPSIAMRWRCLSKADANAPLAFKFGMKLFFRWAHLNLSPAVPGSNSVCGPSLFGTETAFAGGPRFGPLAIPLR